MKKLVRKKAAKRTAPKIKRSSKQSTSQLKATTSGPIRKTTAASPISKLSTKGRSFDGSSLLLEDNAGYPTGSNGEYAICHYLPNQAKWVFHRVGSRDEADRRMQMLFKHPDVLRVNISSGQLSVVVWLMKWNGSDWSEIASAPGADRYLSA